MWGAENGGLPLTLTVAVTTGQHYRAACEPNNHNFISVQDIDTVFACMVGFSGSAISNMPSKFSRELRELPRQPNFDKIKLKLHKKILSRSHRSRQKRRYWLIRRGSVNSGALLEFD